MDEESVLVIYLAGSAIMASLVAIVNAMYFQVKYQKLIDNLMCGKHHIAGGWLFNSTRMMMYAHYCLFRNRTIKDGVFGQVKENPMVVKRHWIVHWCLTIYAGLVVVIMATTDYFLLICINEF